ncbi:hypothetical protein BDA99DRAFT_521057 [Phascolomyces articulosus]|uniref:Uncharacterized protein n=1 Tax=Phascolomyces articulosus TaxID=60185 RepID=A0AAD5K3H8_9FUNG|nr:hypothetical protein BDA99DRAFT_521057 [Phascolomyces articulosus]
MTGLAQFSTGLYATRPPRGYSFYHNKNGILSNVQLDSLFIICSKLQVPYQQLHLILNE